MAPSSPHSDALTGAATAAHRTADLLNSRAIDTEALAAATALIEQANTLLAQGEPKTEEVRGLEFASQMVVPLGAPLIEDGAKFEAFVKSPYSGKHNAMRPTSVSYQRVGDELHAEVLVGPALEGAPGRAHGGLTAAVFDDAMGALQRITGLSGYTRTLHVTYRGKIPIDEAVSFRVWLAEQDDRTFTTDGEVTRNGKTLATARGVFTLIRPEQFIPD